VIPAALAGQGCGLRSATWYSVEANLGVVGATEMSFSYSRTRVENLRGFRAIRTIYGQWGRRLPTRDLIHVIYVTWIMARALPHDVVRGKKDFAGTVSRHSKV
jgi:hypothetical protein